jgi:hypothetical protein
MTTLKYKIENSGVVTRERAIEIDGETGTLSVTRLVVEMLPDGHNGGTLMIDLSPETTGYDEGKVVSVSISVTPATPVGGSE